MTPAKPTKPLLSKEVVSDSDLSESESSSGSSSEPAPPPQSKSKKPAAETSKTKQKKAASPSSSSSESESESESETGATPDAARHGKPSTLSSSKKQVPTKQTVIPAVPARPFVPPEGFVATKSHISKSTDISKAFSDLKGKQIWHLTAPVGVPLSSLETLALDAVATEQPILSHKGVQYRLREDQLGAEKTKALLVPDQQGRVFRRERLPVVQTFHLEQVVDIPNHATLSKDETQTAIKKLSKPLPSKPKHLRMRYRPFGSADGPVEPLGPNSEDSEPEVTFKEPIGLPKDREPKKRKHPDTEIDTSQPDSKIEKGAKGDSPRKKAKKAHAQPPVNGGSKREEPVAASDHEDEERGREKTHHPKASEHKSSKKRKDQTSQERRARREERKRKEAGRG